MTNEEKQKIHAEGATAERLRINRIIGCPEAEGRQKTALTLALETDMTPAQAGKILAASPKADASSFMSTMAGVENPDIGPDGAEMDQSDPSAIRSGWDRAFKSAKKTDAGGPAQAISESARQILQPNE